MNLSFCSASDFSNVTNILPSLLSAVYTYEKCYIIPKYKSIMPDADEFLDEYQNGGTLILGYAKVYANEAYMIYCREQ